MEYIAAWHTEDGKEHPRPQTDNPLNLANAAELFVGGILGLACVAAWQAFAAARDEEPFRPVDGETVLPTTVAGVLAVSDHPTNDLTAHPADAEPLRPVDGETVLPTTVAGVLAVSAHPTNDLTAHPADAEPLRPVDGETVLPTTVAGVLAVSAHPKNDLTAHPADVSRPSPHVPWRDAILVVAGALIASVLHFLAAYFGYLPPPAHSSRRGETGETLLQHHALQSKWEQCQGELRRAHADLAAARTEIRELRADRSAYVA